MAVGCIQAQKCHRPLPYRRGHQSKWLARGLDPTLKAERAANYIRTLRRDLLKVSERAWACGIRACSTPTTWRSRTATGGVPAARGLWLPTDVGAPGPRIRDEITADVADGARF